MPELPDVEVYRRRLDESGLNRRIAEADVRDAGMLANLSKKALADALRGQTLTETRRRGKHLLARLKDGRWLTLHFGMSGDLQPFAPSRDEEPKYTRLRLDFDRGALAYISRRRLGRIGIVDDPDAFFAGQKIGPDALEIDEDTFLDLLSGKRGGVKSALMDQSLMAGIGNVYADEILFQAGVHPRARMSELDRRKRESLFHALRRVLKTAVDAGAGSEAFMDRLPDGFLLPHRHAGGHCPACGQVVRTVQAAGRRSYYCARCQPDAGV